MTIIARRNAIRLKQLAAVVLTALLVAAGCGSDASHASVSSTTAPAATASTSTNVPTPTEVPGSALTGDVAFLGPIKTVPVGKLTMAFRQFGTGPELVMIAGQASPMSVWPVSTLADLAKTHHVTIYDHRDLGGTTPVDSAPFTLEDLADDAAGLIAALGLDRPAVFGWSTGGEVGLLVAIRHPAVLSALAITGAYPGGPKSVLPPESVNQLFSDPNPDLAKLFEVLFSPSGVDAQHEFVADLVKVPQVAVSAEATAQYDVAERKYWSDPEPDLASIKVPVLVMNGADDFAVPAANAEYIAQRIGAKAQLELDPGGRHGWFVEHSGHFDQLMASFLH